MGRQVLALLAERLHGELTCLGWGYEGEGASATDLPYRLLRQGAFGSAQDNLPRVLASRAGTVVITLGDPWAFEPVARVKTKHDFHWIGYLPTDSGPLPRKAVDYLLVADAVASPSSRILAAC